MFPETTQMLNYLTKTLNKLVKNVPRNGTLKINRKIEGLIKIPIVEEARQDDQLEASSILTL
jgi:hypothetical protein